MPSPTPSMNVGQLLFSHEFVGLKVMRGLEPCCWLFINHWHFRKTSSQRKAKRWNPDAKGGMIVMLMTVMMMVTVMIVVMMMMVLVMLSSWRWWWCHQHRPHRCDWEERHDPSMFSFLRWWDVHSTQRELFPYCHLAKNKMGLLEVWPIRHSKIGSL